MCAYTYIYAASDDADDFPVFENEIEESKQLDPHVSSFFTIYTLRKSFADLMERQIFSNRTLLRNKTHNLTVALLRSVQKVKHLIDIVKSDYCDWDILENMRL